MSDLLRESPDPEAAWASRLVHYPDVPRRHVDLAENAIRSVLDDTMTMSRELEDPPGWSIRKSGRSGRVFITVEEALDLGAAHLDSRIRGELAASPDEGDPDMLWARRIEEYAGLPLRSVDAAETVLEGVAWRQRWNMRRTDRGIPGWMLELPLVGWQVFVSAVDLGNRQIEHLESELDRIVFKPLEENPDVEKASLDTIALSRETFTYALREAAAQGMDRGCRSTREDAAACRRVADDIVEAIEAGRFSADLYEYCSESERMATS